MIVAGFGFRAAATEGSLRAALTLAADGPVDALATVEDKARAPCLTALASSLGLPVVAIGAAQLRAVGTVTQSARVRAERGTGSVAEAAALVAAGEGARLLSPRRVSEDRLATCAVAIGGER